MQYQLLGRLEVRDEDGRRLPLGGARQRAVLARLLLQPNAVVDVRALERAVWGGSSPSRSSLYSYVQRLNAVLGGDARVIVAERPGYRLEVEEEQIDSVRFRRLTAAGIAAFEAGEYERAAVRLDDALELWHGPALVGLSGRDFAQEARSLEDLQLTARCTQAEAELRLGRAARQIVPLRADVLAHPDDERLRLLLVRALQAAGRTAEALDAYADAREQVFLPRGVPMPAEWRNLLQALKGRDLKGQEDAAVEDPDRRWSAGSARLAGPAESTVLGREPDLAVLREALTETVGGSGGLVLVSGEPGIGKTYLLHRFASQAREPSLAAVWGRCWEAGGAPPCWPWVEVVDGLVTTVGRDKVLRLLGSRAAVVAQMHDRLAQRLGISPAAPAPESRTRLVDAVSLLLEQVALERPILVLLEDLHVADAITLEVTEAVATSAHRSHLLLVGTYREGEVLLDRARSQAMSALGRLHGTRQRRLGPLAYADAERLLAEAVTGTVPREVAREIHRRANGNPLLIDAWGRALEQARSELPDGPSSYEALIGRLPPDRVETMLGPLERLGTGGKDTIALASVAGRQFSVELLAATDISIPLAEIRRRLDEACKLGVVEYLEPPDRYRFRHDLLREAIVRTLPSTARRRYSQLVGLAIEQVHALDLDAHLGELAQHFGNSDDAGRALEYALRASRNAIQQMAYENAVAHLTAALPLARETGPRGTALLLLGAAHARAGDNEASQHAYQAAARLARTAAEPTLLAQAALGLGEALEFGKVNRPLVALLREALALVGDSAPLRAALMARLAVALYWELPSAEQPSPQRERESLADTAVAIARDGRLPQLGATLHAARYATWSPDLAKRLALDAEILTLADRYKDRELELQGRMWTIVDRLERGELPLVDSEISRYRQLAEELNQPTHLFWARLWQAVRALLDGEFAVVEPIAQEAWEIGRRAQNPDVLQNGCWAVLCRLAIEQGRAKEVITHADTSIAQFPALPIWRAARSLLLADSGDFRRARADLDHFTRTGFTTVPQDGIWLTTMSVFAETAFILDHADSSSVLYELTEAYADRCVVYGFAAACTGSYARHLGQLAALSGNLTVASGHFEHAVRFNEQMGARPYVARSLADWGTALLRTGGPSEVSQGRALLARARDLAAELGMTRVYEEAADRLDRLKAGPERSTPR